MVMQHECQHQETILQSLALYDSPPYVPQSVKQTKSANDEPPSGMVTVPAGEYTMGAFDRAFGYDNEKPAQVVYVDQFEIDVAPVTNGGYLSFVEEGGYNRREFWSETGWSWRRKTDANVPLYWMKVEGQWHRRVFDRMLLLNLHEPVVHVSYWEAKAFAAFEGKRLPTETEWEKAARFDPETGESLRYPWGHVFPNEELANLHGRTYRPAPVGAYPEGASPIGCHQMLGDVYEWTSSDFNGYEGFKAFPYREYSEVFFGNDYKVLRGASWAIAPYVARASYRNWAYPHRRQIFAGFRCAKDIN